MIEDMTWQCSGKVTTSETHNWYCLIIPHDPRTEVIYYNVTPNWTAASQYLWLHGEATLTPTSQVTLFTDCRSTRMCSPAHIILLQSVPVQSNPVIWVRSVLGPDWPLTVFLIRFWHWLFWRIDCWPLTDCGRSLTVSMMGVIPPPAGKSPRVLLT